MSDTNKWIASARVSLDELEKSSKWQRNQRVQFLVQVDDLEKEVKRLREAILEFADYLEEKVTPYMTNDMHEVVPIGGMVSDLHKMIKGDE